MRICASDTGAHTRRQIVLALTAVGMLFMGGSLQAQPGAIPPGEYKIVNGRVDPRTYTGWKLFHSACHGCHGIDATGTERAPDLVESIQRMTPRTFARKVITSYGLIARVNAAGGDSRAALAEMQLEEILKGERSEYTEVKMPAWGESKLIRPHVLDIYAYLTARADGLQIGEPKIIEANK